MFAGERCTEAHKEGVCRVTSRNRRDILLASSRKDRSGSPLLVQWYPCSRMIDKISFGIVSNGDDASSEQSQAPATSSSFSTSKPSDWFASSDVLGRPSEDGAK